MKHHSLYFLLLLLLYFCVLLRLASSFSCFILSSYLLSLRMWLCLHPSRSDAPCADTEEVRDGHLVLVKTKKQNINMKSKNTNKGSPFFFFSFLSSLYTFHFSLRYFSSFVLRLFFLSSSRFVLLYVSLFSVVQIPAPAQHSDESFSPLVSIHSRMFLCAPIAAPEPHRTDEYPRKCARSLIQISIFK